jgi:hypothetical protein
VLLQAVSDGVQSTRDVAEQAVHARQVISLYRQYNGSTDSQ